jgi:hypothetical protein
VIGVVMASLNDISSVLGKGRSPQEQRIIHEYLSKVESSSGNLSGGGRLVIDRIEATSGVFDIFPAGVLHLDTTGTTTEITSGSGSAVVFADVESKDGAFFDWSASAPTKIYVKHSSAKTLMVFGNMTFESAAGGRRAVTVNFYNAQTDALVVGYTAASIEPATGDATTVPFMLPINIAKWGSNAYITITGHQDSGGPIDITFCNAGFMVIK